MHIPVAISLLLIQAISTLGQQPPNCKNPKFRWTIIPNYLLDARYLFCGVLAPKSPMGLHSQALKGTWDVVNNVGAPKYEENGIYRAEVTFSKGMKKNSVFFPNACSFDQVKESVRNAVKSKQAIKSNWYSTNWYQGKSAPKEQAKDCCLASNNSFFNIRFKLENSQILKAFPANKSQDPYCDDPDFKLTDANVPVNARHIFCGEYNPNGVGLHSQQLEATWDIVASVGAPKGESDGLYSAEVTFKNGDVKLSSFFPNACSYEQINKSIFYARQHGGKVPGKQYWYQGPSAPINESPKTTIYCLATNNSNFNVLFCKNGTYINTAFPNLL